MRGALAQKKGWSSRRPGSASPPTGSHNKYRSRCYRGACFRRVGGATSMRHSIADRADLSAWDTSPLAVRTIATVHQVLMDPKLARRGRRSSIGNA
jgi:hypothetical protein